MQALDLGPLLKAMKGGKDPHTRKKILRGLMMSLRKEYFDWWNQEPPHIFQLGLQYLCWVSQGGGVKWKISSQVNLWAELWTIVGECEWPASTLDIESD